MKERRHILKQKHSSPSSHHYQLSNSMTDSRVHAFNIRLISLHVEQLDIMEVMDPLHISELRDSEVSPMEEVQERISITMSMTLLTQL